MSMTKKKVVVIGGGNGSAVVLQALQSFSDRFDLSAVISVSDSGGSSGRLRRDLGVLPPGDVLRAVLALSPYDQKMLRQIFYSNRFQNLSALTGHNLGNLFLALGSHGGQDFLLATRALEQSVAAVGHVYPVALEQTHLIAELTNDQRVEGEATIDQPTYDRSLKIKRVWLEPAVPAAADALTVIREADYLILAPGSLYGSLISTLLPVGVRESIAANPAPLWYFSARGFRADAETGPECLSGAVTTLEAYLPRGVDLVIYNSAELTAVQKQYYERERWGVFDNDAQNLPGRDVRGLDFELSSGGYSAEKLAAIIVKVFQP